MNKKLLKTLGISSSLLFGAVYFDLIEYKDNVIKVKFYKGAELTKNTPKTETKNKEVTSDKNSQDNITENSEQDIEVDTQNTLDVTRWA